MNHGQRPRAPWKWLRRLRRAGLIVLVIVVLVATAWPLSALTHQGVLTGLSVEAAVLSCAAALVRLARPPYAEREG